MFFKFHKSIINSNHINYVDIDEITLNIYVYLTNHDRIEFKCKNLEALNKAFDLLLYRLNNSKEKQMAEFLFFSDTGINIDNIDFFTINKTKTGITFFMKGDTNITIFKPEEISIEDFYKGIVNMIYDTDEDEPEELEIN